MRSHKPHRHFPLIYRIGFAVLLLAAAFSTVQTARGQTLIPGAKPPLSTLVKFEGRDYAIGYDETVSLDPVSTTIVRRIGYGHTTDVSIVTTASGTYSSDGLTSAHVLYPGLSVERVVSAERDTRDGDRLHGPGFSILSIGRSPNGGTVLNWVDDLGVRSCLGRGSVLTCYRTY